MCGSDRKVDKLKKKTHGKRFVKFMLKKVK